MIQIASRLARITRALMDANGDEAADFLHGYSQATGLANALRRDGRDHDEILGAIDGGARALSNGSAFQAHGWVLGGLREASGDAEFHAIVADVVGCAEALHAKASRRLH